MNNLGNRRNKINSCMAELFNLYMDDKKQIVASVEMDGVKCKLTFGEEIVNKPKSKLAIEYLRNIAINFKTEKEVEQCCMIADKLGLRWHNGDSYASNGLVGPYNSQTCYNFLEGTYCYVDFYKKKGYTIKSAQWFIDNFKIKD